MNDEPLLILIVLRMGTGNLQYITKRKTRGNVWYGPTHGEYCKHSSRELASEDTALIVQES